MCPVVPSSVTYNSTSKEFKLSGTYTEAAHKASLKGPTALAALETPFGNGTTGGFESNIIDVNAFLMVRIKISIGSIGIEDDALKSLTRKQVAHLSDADWELVKAVKDERFPPVVKKAAKSEPG